MYHETDDNLMLSHMTMIMRTENLYSLFNWFECGHLNSMPQPFFKSEKKIKKIKNSSNKLHTPLQGFNH